MVVIHEVARDGGSGWRLCYQFCRYNFPDGESRTGFRFMWKDDTGKLKTYRGGARIYSSAMAMGMIVEAIEQGWGNLVGTLPEDEELMVDMPVNGESSR